MLNGYTPVFTNAPESIYEMEITRAAIHSFATFCSKLKPEVTGSARAALGKTLQYRANPFMSTSQFLYRVATILSVNNTAFIVPMENEYGQTMVSFPCCRRIVKYWTLAESLICGIPLRRVNEPRLSSNVWAF